MNTTVVISNYNYEKYVGSCIKSCINQTVSCKIIVVDDASIDSSWKTIKKYASDQVKCVRLKSNSNGNARGKNVGICLSDTKYITCLDSDDMLIPTSIEDRESCFTDNVDFVHGWARSVKTLETYKSIRKTQQKLLDSTKLGYSDRIVKLSTEEETRWAWAIEASTVLAKADIYEKFGLYDEIMRWKIDREMWWRWLSHGAKKKVIQKYVSIYRQHPDQLTRSNKKNPKKCTKMLVKLKKVRENISKENTLLIPHYNYNDFIGDVV